MRGFGTFVVALAIGGCGEEQVAPVDVGSEVVADVVDVADGGRLVFRAPAVEHAAIAVELVELDDRRLVVDVAARGLAPADRVMAAGFRLSYDPAVLGFVSAAPGEPWAGSAGVTMASGATPGVVVAGVAHGRAFYEEPSAPAGDQVLYRLTFDVKAVAPTPLALVGGRSRAFVWPGGEAPVNVQFIGGELGVEP